MRHLVERAVAGTYFSYKHPLGDHIKYSGFVWVINYDMLAELGKLGRIYLVLTKQE